MLSVIVSVWHRHRSSSRARKGVGESVPGGGGVVMSGAADSAANSNATPTSVSSSAPGSQLTLTTGEDDTATSASSATGNALNLLFRSIFLPGNVATLLIVARPDAA